MKQTIPTGWQKTTLGEVIDKSSSNLSSNKLVECDGVYPVYGASGLLKKVNFYQQKNDYLAIIKDGAGVGRVYHHEAKSSVLGTLQYLLPKKCINIRFAYYYLQSIDFEKYYQGAAIPHIYYKDYKAEKIFLPPLSEQKRIVEKLDKIFEAINKAKEKTEQNIENIKKLFFNELEKLCTINNSHNEIKSLSDVCSISSSLVDPRTTENIQKLHIGGANIESETGNLIDLKTSKEENLISGKFNFDATMVLYNKIRPYLKKVERPDFDGLCSADIYPLKPNSKIIRDYLFYLLLTKNFTDYAEKGSARAGMPKVNRTHLFSYSFHIPPIETQKTTVTTLNILRNYTDKYKSLLNSRLKFLDELKQAILNKAFQGEL